MPQVRAARVAHDFIPHHPMAVVAMHVDRLRRHLLIEARPAAARIELCRRVEQQLAADDAVVLAVFLMVPILAGEGSFGPLLLGDMVLLGREPGPQFGVVGLG